MALVRTATLDEMNAALAAGPRSPAQAANRVRRLLNTHLEQAKLVAARIHDTVERAGLDNLVAALGSDGADLVPTYAALKTSILALDPSAEVPDLS